MNRNSVLGTLISILIEILLILVLVFVIWGAGKWAYSFGYAIFAEKTVEEEPGTDIQVTITEGQSNRQISKMLEEKGLIRDADPFYVLLMLTDYKKLIQPGTYTLNTSMQSEEMMAVMSGETDEDEEN